MGACFKRLIAVLNLTDLIALYRGLQKYWYSGFYYSPCVFRGFLGKYKAPRVRGGFV